MAVGAGMYFCDNFFKTKIGVAFFIKYSTFDTQKNLKKYDFEFKILK